MNPISHAFHRPLAAPLAHPQCPADLLAPVAPPELPHACPSMPSPWALAQFEPLHPPSRPLAWLAHTLFGTGAPADGSLQASAALRGQGLLAPAPAQARAEKLQADGAAARKILAHYARAREAARLPGEPAWLARLGQERQPLLLAAHHEAAPLALHAGAAPTSARVVHVPQRDALLVDVERFFQPGTHEPTARTRRDLQALFLHPRCAELLPRVQRLLPNPRDDLGLALHRWIMGERGADTPRHLQPLLEALLRGDEAQVARALFHRSVPMAVGLNPVMPRPSTFAQPPKQVAHAETLADELQDLASEALSLAQPRTAHARALVKLLGHRPLSTLAHAFVRGDRTALQRVCIAYAVVVHNDAARAFLAPMVGRLDLLSDLEVALTFHADGRALGDMLARKPLPRTLQADGLDASAVTFLDPQARQTAMNAGVAAVMDIPDFELPAGHGQLSRAELRARSPGTDATIHFALASAASGRMHDHVVLHEVVSAYQDPAAFGASQGIAAALKLTGTEDDANFVAEYLLHYAMSRLTGRERPLRDPESVIVTRRAIEARAQVDGVSFQQAEADILGVLFRERSFGLPSDFRALERLARCLYEQRKMEALARITGSGDALATVHVVGGSVAGGTWVEVVEPWGGDGYIIRPLGAMPRPSPEGTIRLPDGRWLADSHRVVSVKVPATLAAQQGKRNH